MPPSTAPTRVTAVLLAVALAAALVACGESRAQRVADGPAGTGADVVVEPVGEPVRGGELSYGLEAESNGWLPSTARWSASGLVVANAVYDPLASLTPDLTAEPFLAESFEASPDARTWTIRLRDGIRFVDGTPLDAAAVAAALDAARTSPLLEAALEPVTAVTVIDDRTVQVDSSEPWATLPLSLTGQLGVVPAPGATATGLPVGTGPFRMTEWRPDEVTVVERNDDYWQEGLPYLDAVRFVPVPEATPRLLAVRSGDLDVAHLSTTTVIAEADEAAAAGELQIVRARGEAEEDLVVFNTSAAPLDDVGIRRALVEATDLDAYATTVEIGPDQLADSFLSPGSEWYAQTDHPTYDPDAAAAAVTAWEAQHGPLRITLATTTDSAALALGMFLDEQWTRAGADVTVTTREQGAYITEVLGGRFEAAVWRQFDGADPDVDALWFESRNAVGDIALNVARNADPAIDEAFAEGRSTTDRDVRRRAYARVQERLAADVPYLWLSRVEWALVARPDVHGFAESTFPDGAPRLGFANGVSSLARTWIG